MVRYLILTLAVTLILGCGANTNSENNANTDAERSAQNDPVDATTLQNDLESLINFFSAQSGKSLDKGKANEMIEKTAQFVALSPNDPKAGSYLFMSGEVARSVGRHEDAINIFSKVESKYEDYEKAPAALFLKAFTYEENLSNTEMAKKYYQEFLEKYPDHELAKEVKQLLAVIDISPEELIKRFQQQNQQ